MSAQEKKPRITADGTYVFQEEDIEAYDDLSVTMAMRDASSEIEKKLKAQSGEADPTLSEFEFDSLDSDD